MTQQQVADKVDFDVYMVVSKLGQSYGLDVSKSLDYPTRSKVKSKLNEGVTAILREQVSRELYWKLKHV